MIPITGLAGGAIRIQERGAKLCRDPCSEAILSAEHPKSESTFQNVRWGRETEYSTRGNAKLEELRKMIRANCLAHEVPWNSLDRKRWIWFKDLPLPAGSCPAESGTLR